MQSPRLRSTLLTLFVALLGSAPMLKAAEDQECLACHGVEVAKDTGAPAVDPAKFAGSVHAANGCQSCHADVDPAKGHPGNPVAKVDCSMCHSDQADQYRDSVHAHARAEGRKAANGALAPSCLECHGAQHEIIKTKTDTFRRSLLGRCGGCHIEQSETYSDTYHGKVTRLGYTATAECYDCHGAHGIQKPDDPRSQVNKANLVATCGKCHPGSNAGFVKYIPHGNHHDCKKYPALFIAFWAMTLLLIGTFMFFGIHSLLWLPRALKLRREIAEEGARKAAEEEAADKEGEERHD